MATMDHWPSRSADSMVLPVGCPQPVATDRQASSARIPGDGQADTLWMALLDQLRDEREFKPLVPEFGDHLDKDIEGVQVAGTYVADTNGHARALRP